MMTKGIFDFYFKYSNTKQTAAAVARSHRYLHRENKERFRSGEKRDCVEMEIYMISLFGRQRQIERESLGCTILARIIAYLFVKWRVSYQD